MQLEASERPVAGAHAQEMPPEPESGVDVPAQIAAVPAAAATGRAFTVTMADPEAVPEQSASLTDVTL